MAEDIPEKEQAQSKISEIVERLEKIKVAYFSSELEQLRADSLQISHGLYRLGINLEDLVEEPVENPYLAPWETISSLIRRTLTEVRRFSEIRLSTLEPDTTYTSVLSRLKQNSINTDEIVEGLDKFTDENFVATPLKKSLSPILLDLMKAQIGFENDFYFLALPFIKSEIDEDVKQSARKIGVLSKAEIEASSKAMSSDQPTVKLEEILKQTKDLSDYVHFIGGGFNLHADDTTVTRAHEFEILQTSFAKLISLRSDIQEITRNDLEIFGLKKQICDLLDKTGKHLELLDLISKEMLNFRGIRSTFSNPASLPSDVRDCPDRLRKNMKAILELRKKIEQIPEDQADTTLKLLNNFVVIQNKCNNFFKETSKGRFSEAREYIYRSDKENKIKDDQRNRNEHVIAYTSLKLSFLKIEFGMPETSPVRDEKESKKSRPTQPAPTPTPQEIKNPRSEIIKETPEYTGSPTSIVSSTPPSPLEDAKSTPPTVIPTQSSIALPSDLSRIEFIQRRPSKSIRRPSDNSEPFPSIMNSSSSSQGSFFRPIPKLNPQWNTANLKKPLAIGFGFFLVSLVIGVVVPTITALEIGKDETLEFLFSSDKGMSIVASYAGLEGLLGAALIAWSIYNFCTQQCADSRVAAPR